MGRIQYVDAPVTKGVTRHVTKYPPSRDAIQHVGHRTSDEVMMLKRRIAELELALAGSKKGDALRANAYRARKRIKPTPSVLGAE